MDNSILGLCIVRNADDKNEEYVQYIISELQKVCQRVELVDGNVTYEQALVNTSMDEMDYVIITDADAFGPVTSLNNIVEKCKREAIKCYSIPHFVMLKKGETLKLSENEYELYNIYEDIAYNNHIFIPKAAFTNEKKNVLKYNSGGDLRKCMDFVSANLRYDTDMIYRYLVKHYNLNDIKDSLNLNYVLAENYEPAAHSEKKVAAVSHMYYEDLFEYDLRYLRNLPDNADLFLTTDSVEKKMSLEKMFKPVFGDRVSVIIVEKRGRELSALLISCKDIPKNYDYFCFIHDKKSSQVGLATVGASFRDLLWENMLFNKNYVEHILNTFDANPWLGMLIPPNVSHGTYFGTSADYWTICYNQVMSIASRLNLTADIDREKPPIAIGSVFWCKSDAIKPLMEEEWQYDDFPKEPLPDDGSFSHALERVFPYVAQSQGYLSAIVMTTEYAQTEISDYRYMMTGTIKSMIGLPIVKMTDFHEFSSTTHEVTRLINEGEFDVGLKRTIKNFINKHTPLNIGGRK